MPRKKVERRGRLKEIMGKEAGVSYTTLNKSDYIEKKHNRRPEEKI